MDIGFRQKLHVPLLISTHFQTNKDSNTLQTLKTSFRCLLLQWCGLWTRPDLERELQTNL